MHGIKQRLEILKQKTIAEQIDFQRQFNENQQAIIDEMMNSYADKLIKVIMTNLKNATNKEDLIAITQTLNDTFSIEE